MAVEMGAPKRELYNEVNRLAQAVDSGGGGGNVNVVQTTGQSTTDVMSQKAITDLLEDANATFARKDGEYVDMVVGKAVMAQVDAEGSYIPDKYAKKTELPTIAQGTGTSTTSVMSQKAATDNFALKSSVPPIVQYVGDSTTSVMSQSGVKNALLSFLPVDGSDLKVGLTKTSLVSGMTYLDCKITATVSSGTYYFYNCTGTVTVSGTSAKVYAVNCPDLIKGKTADNWQNIWIDGKRTINYNYADKVSSFSLPFDSYNYCFVHVMDAARDYVGATISFSSNAMNQWVNVIADDSGTFKYFSGQLEAKWSDGYYKFSSNVGGAKISFYIVNITLV